MVGNLYADDFSKEKDPISVFLKFILGFSAKNGIICVFSEHLLYSPEL